MHNNSNLTVLFPADAAYWHGFETVSVWEAILLSLGIEPRIIADLAAQRDPLDESGEIHYGQQQIEFVNRSASLRNAITSGTIQLLSSQDKIRLISFVDWASMKHWQLPKWLAMMSSSYEPPQNQIEAADQTGATLPEQHFPAISNSDENRYMTMEEVTTMLGTSRSTINDAVRDGRFAKKLKPFGGRAIRFDRAEIMALMEQNKTNDSGKTHNKSTKE